MKDFRVTPEILDLFRNEKVQARTVKKLIPNYLDYQLQFHFNFNGSCLDEGYGYYQISETVEKIYIESEAALLERICKEIREAKKKEKEELQNIKITNEM